MFIGHQKGRNTKVGSWVHARAAGCINGTASLAEVRYGMPTLQLGMAADLSLLGFSTLCCSTSPLTQENIYRNFGMPQPNGYRKALRFMRHADKFGAFACRQLLGERQARRPLSLG